MKKIYLIISILCACAFSACDMDQFPDNEMTPEELGGDPSGAEYATDGNYAMFKEQMEYKGASYTGSTYVRYYFQMAEFIGDNTCLAGRTSDPLYEALTYKRSTELRNITYLWWSAYKIISGANYVIESVSDETNPKFAHLKGENYFLRAVAHLHLSVLWSKPYSHGRDNIGVILRTSTDNSVTERATVGVVYDQIVADLVEAIRLMGLGEKRGNAGFASKEAAQALLVRTYLYMERDNDVIQLANEMLGGASPESKLEPSASFPNYYATALISQETLWAIAHTERENRGSSSLASMYLTDKIGWGEIYASDPLIDLIGRYPNDIRNIFIRPKYLESAPNTYTIRWAIPSKDDFHENKMQEVKLDIGTNKYYFTEGASTIYVETESINGYPQNYIQLEGTKHRVRLNKKMEDRYGWPKYFVTKFSYQGGDPMLSSPPVLRWAEVILNRAEAYAKTSQAALALSDVNTIRSRAGLSGTELFSTTNMHGYANALDVVLDERRLELSFEGHRALDIYRNKKSLDRKYSGAQPWEIIEHTNNKIQYYIPQDEITSSGIPQNP